MTRDEEAKAAVGKSVIHRKKGSAYRVTEAKADMVYLSAETPGARSTWKWVGHLWSDYREAV